MLNIVKPLLKTLGLFVLYHNPHIPAFLFYVLILTFELVNSLMGTPLSYLELPSLSFVKLANCHCFCKSKMIIAEDAITKY